MTMLDRMRRPQELAEVESGLVCLAFIIFYISRFLRGSGKAGAVSTDTIAAVDGSPISTQTSGAAYQAQLQAYRSAYGANVSEQLLKQLGVEQQVLQQLVDERAALAEADRVRISCDRRGSASAHPPHAGVPGKTGAFIGEQRYTQLLRMQRPPIEPSEFEDQVRRSLVIDKLRASMTDWVSVSDTDLEQSTTGATTR